MSTMVSNLELIRRVQLFLMLTASQPGRVGGRGGRQIQIQAR